MKLRKTIRQDWILVFGLLAAMASISATAAKADGYGLGKVVEPGEEYAGKTYNELVSQWSNWLVKEPFATNPAFDLDGSLCDRNQEGRVWFLASTFEGVANRTCEIPGGKAIFVSLGGAFLSFAPEFPEAGDPCLALAPGVGRVRCDVNRDVPGAPAISLEAALDGVPVKDLFAYRTESEPGGFTLRAGNPSFLTDLGFPAGNRTPSVASGYFLFLRPLSRGLHTLRIRMVNPDQTVTGVNYRLVIGDGHDD